MPGRFGIDTNSRVTDLVLPGAFPGYPGAITWCGRYLRDDGWIDPRTGYSPLFTVEEARWCAAHRMDVVTFFQEGKAEGVLNGYRAGVEKADLAQTLLRQRGGVGAPVPVAVDFTPEADQLPVIGEHFRGWRSVIGWDRLGVYGPLSVVRYLLNQGLVSFAIQSTLGDWTNTLDPRAAAVQYENTDNSGGFNFGSKAYLAYDRAIKGSFGQWRPRFD
jgi:hypothetical protein